MDDGCGGGLQPWLPMVRRIITREMIIKHEENVLSFDSGNSRCFERIICKRAKMKIVIQK